MKNLLELSKNLHFNRILPIDLLAIDEIYKRYYSNLHLPDLRHSIGDGTIYSDDKLVGFGLIKLRPECIIFLDKSLDKKIKSAALVRLYTEAVKSAQHNNYDELLAVSHDNEYSNLLNKHLDFEPQDGKLMRLEI